MLLITTSIYESEWIFWRENICPSLSELWFPEPILSQNLQKYLQIYGPTSWNLKSLKAGNWSHSTSHLPHLLIDALFKIAGKWNQRKCSSTDGWTMTFWYICETTLFSSKFKKKTANPENLQENSLAFSGRETCVLSLICRCTYVNTYSRGYDV